MDLNDQEFGNHEGHDEHGGPENALGKVRLAFVPIVFFVVNLRHSPFRIDATETVIHNDRQKMQS